LYRVVDKISLNLITFSPRIFFHYLRWLIKDSGRFAPLNNYNVFFSLVIYTLILTGILLYSSYSLINLELIKILISILIIILVKNIRANF